MPLLDVLVPNASADAVAVFDQDFNQVFQNARPIKATYNRTKKLCEHPVEDGTVITDHQVIQPPEIQLSLILGAADYRSVYQQIKQLYTDGTLLTVQGRTDTFTDLVITDMPHDEEPDLFDVVAVAVKLRNVQFVTAQFGTLPASKVANPADASTVQKGEQQTTDNGQNGSLLYRAFF
jgi:hypothetical protein